MVHRLQVRPWGHAGIPEVPGHVGRGLSSRSFKTRSAAYGRGNARVSSKGKFGCVDSGRWRTRRSPGISRRARKEEGGQKMSEPDVGRDPSSSAVPVEVGAWQTNADQTREGG